MKKIQNKKLRISRKTKKRLKKNEYASLFYRTWIRELINKQLQKRLEIYWGIKYGN